MNRISSAEAKARFSELLARVAFSNERFIIERRGKPLAAVISMSDLERLELDAKKSQAEWPGFLAWVGAWKGIVTDEEIDAMVEHIYEERKRNLGRPVEL